MTDQTPTPPAAPTTPDIADERVRFLVDALREANNVLRNLIVQVCESPDRRSTLEHVAETIDGMEMHGDAELMAAFSVARNAAWAALATPSTPGAGQGDPS